ncbi:hypothetical protein R3P38DRAFT_2558902 [Favolaschia claudopus]|uniref:G-protein coupled receptors family 1 profile domain-containing protein n=1 Tax=Favolaschia claudopus TaxID=2862362 RepID=A0AAW0A660_9AGAR
MTPDEAATLHDIGIDWVHTFVAITNETFLLAVYAVAVIYALLVLRTKLSRGSKAQILTVAALVIMFLIALVLWTLDLANFIMEGKITLIQNPEDGIDTKYARALAFIFRLAAAQDALYAYMALLGDAIIIHRVWVLKAYYRPWIFMIPCALLVGSFIATLMLTYCVAVTGSEIILGNFEKPAFCRNVQTVTYAMPLATTTVATALIGIMTWKYRKISQPLAASTSNGTSKARRRRGERVLILLVESGFLYFLFFLIQVIEDIPRVHDWVVTQPGVSFAFQMYSYCSSIMVGIYPTLVVVLAHSKHAVIDKAATSSYTQNSGSRMQNSHQTGSHTWPQFKVEVETRVEDMELETIRAKEQGRN